MKLVTTTTTGRADHLLARGQGDLLQLGAHLREELRRPCVRTSRFISAADSRASDEHRLAGQEGLEPPNPRFWRPMLYQIELLAWFLS